jgi:hypothetical protein
MKDKYGLLLITADVGLIVIKTTIMRCVIQNSDVPETEKSEEQDETCY